MKKILAILLIMVILWLQYRVWLGSNSQKKLIVIKQEIIQQKQQYRILTDLNRELQQENILLRNDPDILEEKAREQMGMVKKKEIFYRIIVEPQDPKQKN